MKLLAIARDLKRRKARERQRRFVAEGVRTVEALFDSPLVVHGLLVTADTRHDKRANALRERSEQLGVPCLEVDQKDFDSAANTDTPQGVLAVANIPDRTVQSELPVVPEHARFLVLDALQDPGNVGTIIRTASALGVTATLAMPGTVDLWNAKVVRSAMGTLFTHSAFTVTEDQLSALLHAHRVACWAADTNGVPLRVLARHLPDRIALVVSNEGAGLSPVLETIVHQRIAIEMSPGVESLNVAVAAGILLHALRPVAPGAH